MNIEEELLDFLANFEPKPGKVRLDGEPRRMKAPDPVNQKRNSDIVMDRFGFGLEAEFWPTLEELATKYDLGSRERVRQIVTEAYTQRLVGPMPAAAAVAGILTERDFWLESEFLSMLMAGGLVGPFSYAAGLLEYLETQNLGTEYKTYLPDLSQASRSSYHSVDERLIINARVIDDLRADLKVAAGIPKQAGLASMAFVQKIKPDADVDSLQSLIRCHSHAWSTTRRGEFWFAFENRKNVLVSYARKTFSIVDSCPLDMLARILTNSLRTKSPKFRYPDEELVLEWLSRSSHFVVTDGQVSLEGDHSELTDVEIALVNLMHGKGALTTTYLGSELEKQGFLKPSVQKAVYYSPLVMVDRSAGHSHYTCLLVTDLPEATVNSKPSRYAHFRDRLRKLGETNGETVGSTRREQPILAEWIFGKDAVGHCAICARQFARRALVVAHKKKRKYCTEVERTDPNIVFPLCLFGCDYLYEHGFVTIKDGVVVIGQGAPASTEQEEVSSLLGRPVDPRWTKGPSSYFDNLPTIPRLAAE